MHNIMQRIVIALGLALILATAVSSGQAQENHTLVLENNSGFDIYEVHLSSTSTDLWGPDLLGRRVLRVGQQFNIYGVADDDYDMKIIDEDGDECVRQISIHSNRTLNITPERLIGCELHQLQH